MIRVDLKFTNRTGGRVRRIGESDGWYHEGTTYSALSILGESRSVVSIQSLMLRADDRPLPRKLTDIKRLLSHER